MPSRKQRRRREKDRRHEYEYVYVDDDGREVAVEEDATDRVSQRDGKGRDGSRRNGAPASGRLTQARGQAATGRAVSPPSWSRVFKRAALFGPLMFVTVALLDRKLGVAGQLLITLQMLVLFVPFSYLVDRMMYRRAQRLVGAPARDQRASRRGS
jgi:hypothetical protein